MMKMSDKKELMWIAGAAVALFILNPLLPERMEIGYVLVSLTLLFLIQSLIRDLRILFRRESTNAEAEAGRFTCLESVVGFTPLIAAVVLIAAGWRERVDLPRLFWPLAGTAVMLSCFMIKDFVIDLKTLRVRKHPDHVNMVFRWNSR